MSVMIAHRGSMRLAHAARTGIRGANARPGPSNGTKRMTEPLRPTLRFGIVESRGLVTGSIKGKERAMDPGMRVDTAFKDFALSGQRWRDPQASTLIWRRRFHASARRNALPLIPAGAAILKSTSLLAIITAISRILISFFPLGTIAAFRNARIVRWAADEERKPVIGAEAEEFWKMWCEGERGIKLSKEDAQLVLEGNLQPDGSVLDARGRKAWAHTAPPPGPMRKNYKRFLDPAVLREDKDMAKKPFYRTMFLRASRYYMPPLPSSAERYYDELDPSTRLEVDTIRRYWISLRAIKDHLRSSRWCFGVLFLLPCFLILGVYATALERVPLTGRWRIILLTPDDEDTITASLAGAKWYRYAKEQVAGPGGALPREISPADWRYGWVLGVLRRLEHATIVAAQACDEGRPYPGQVGDVLPPNSRHPLRPRPRASARLHSALPGGESHSGKEHLELGPPYNLMLVEKQGHAMSYGFGKGSSGIVVYSGLLDEILAEGAAPESDAPPPPRSKGLFGGLFSAPAPPRTAVPPMPTEEQTRHLACVLAHEMGHLLLSHGLESISHKAVLWPSVLGFSMDLVRAFIWPLTIFLGPAVNDALAKMGQTSSDELVNRYGGLDFLGKHEYEADLVALRILAHAGYTPEQAVESFSQALPDLHGAQIGAQAAEEGWTDSVYKLWTRATHPSNESRLRAVRAEMERWEGLAREQRVEMGRGI